METIIEVLLPRNYTPGDKVTDKIMANLSMIYSDIVFTDFPTGDHGQLIILNSYLEHHSEMVLSVYPPEKTWYYMYDMNWGRQFYEKHKDRLQLISDKPYPGSRFLIPTGMMALSDLPRPITGNRKGKICVMESFKSERIRQYDKFLQSGIGIDVIGTTMNLKYKHRENKVDSVPYSELPTLLKDYSYCLVFWDEYHSINHLPLKVAECLENGVLPILVSQYGNSIFPTINSITELVDYIHSNKGQTDVIYANIVNHYRNTINFSELRRSAQLIETDELYLKELEQLLQWGREKHRGHYWRDNLDVKDFIEALKRHLKAYESGEKIDPETGLSHLVSIGANAMFKRRIDYEK